MEKYSEKKSPVPKEGIGPVPNQGIKEEPSFKNIQKQYPPKEAAGYLTPSADDEERHPSQAQSNKQHSYSSADEDEYLQFTEDIFSKHSPAVINDKQRRKLIKAHRRHKSSKITSKGKEYTLTLAQLYEATAYYARNGELWSDATMYRIINGALNWQVGYPGMTLEDWRRQLT
jgi:hypothetical protein